MSPPDGNVPPPPSTEAELLIPAGHAELPPSQALAFERVEHLASAWPRALDLARETT